MAHFIVLGLPIEFRALRNSGTRRREHVAVLGCVRTMCGLLSPSLQLVCPTTAEVAAFREAIQRGDVVWNGGPMNMQYEAMDGGLVAASLLIAQVRVGLPHERVEHPQTRHAVRT